MKFIEVVAAVIFKEDKFLCVQRGKNKYPYISEKWEFPGGKIEADETKEEAIKREIYEELRMSITTLQFLITINHEYPDFNVTMHAFICNTSEDKPVLTEHLDFSWKQINEMPALDWAAADLPILLKLKQYTNEI